MEYTAPYSHPGRKHLSKEEIFVARDQLGTLDKQRYQAYEPRSGAANPKEAPPTSYWAMKDGSRPIGLMTKKQMKDVSIFLFSEHNNYTQSNKQRQRNLSYMVA